MNAPPSVDIVPENVHAVQAVHFAFQLEQMRVFEVVERIVELFRQGLLPLGGGSAGEALQRYFQAGDRLTEGERKDLYARAFGAPGGDADAGEANDEFLDLWLRFVSSVALYSRPRTAAEILPALPTRADAHVGSAARALAVSASARGEGLTQAARRLSADVQAGLAVLREPAIGEAFGARDLWQVIDQVNTLYLGGAVNVTRYRTQAQAGSVILGWLAAHTDALQTPGAAANGPPSDADLLRAVEQWVAVSGIRDAQDLLHAAGFPAGRDARAHPPRAVVLFCGPAGSGKTLAAYMLAEALALSILRIDLSRVVNKWIGETEKNLDRLFARARESDAILFFDEADALFEKRTEVTDARDRYTNAETAYLLQRIEAFEGLSILASNLAPETDDGFVDRRWQRICFPRPRG